MLGSLSGGKLVSVIDDFAKDYPHGKLRSIRQAAGGSHHADLAGAHRAVRTL